jgi:hypothetical protein
MSLAHSISLSYFEPIWLTMAMDDSPDEQQPRPEDDPEIAALLNFKPAPRQKRGNGWTSALQKKFIAHLALTGSPELASEALQKNRHGVQKVYRDKRAEEFRAAWDAAVALFEQREADRIERECAGLAGLTPPFVDRRRSRAQPVRGTGEHEARSDIQPIPVVCSQCSAEGVAGDEAFADIPYLLAFDPVPRPAHDRLWDPATQRAFVAALAVTGSIERAARSIKRHGFAVEKLRKSRGAREFNEACEAALDVARQRELMKMGGKLAELGSDDGGAEVEGYSDDAIEEVRERVFAKLQKLRKRMLRNEIIPDAKKRRAWKVLNGPEEIDALERELHEARKSTEPKTADGEADKSTSARDEHRSHAGEHGEKRNGSDRTAGRLASSETNPSDGEGEFISPEPIPSPLTRAVPRIINMNDPDAYERLCSREDRPWIPAGSLPREPRWPRRESPVQGSGGGEEEAQQAFKEWEAHVDAGRVGPKKPD